MQIVADGAHHHFTGVEADTALEGQPWARRTSCGIPAKRRLHGQRRITGPGGMIFMGYRSPKESHDAVAQHLVDRAVVAVHRVHHGLQGRVEELLDGFGSRSRMSASESLRSAQSTVTCLRSPSRAV